MARVSIPSIDQVSDKLKDVFQSMEQRGVQVLNVFKVMAHCPRVGREFLRLGNAILFNGSLPPKLRELAILRVGDLAEATYEWTQHVPLGLTAGLTEEQIKTMHRWKDSPVFSDRAANLGVQTSQAVGADSNRFQTSKKAHLTCGSRRLVHLARLVAGVLSLEPQYWLSSFCSQKSMPLNFIIGVNIYGPNRA